MAALHFGSGDLYDPHIHQFNVQLRRRHSLVGPWRKAACETASLEALRCAHDRCGSMCERRTDVAKRRYRRLPVKELQYVDWRSLPISRYRLRAAAMAEAQLSYPGSVGRAVAKKILEGGPREVKRPQTSILQSGLQGTVFAPKQVSQATL